MQEVFLLYTAAVSPTRRKTPKKAPLTFERTTIPIEPSEREMVDFFGGKARGVREIPSIRKVVSRALDLARANAQAEGPLTADELSLLLELYPTPVDLASESLSVLPHLLRSKHDFPTAAERHGVDAAAFISRLTAFSQLELLSLGPKLMREAATRPQRKPRTRKL